jgi:hypothetical protein
MEGQVAKWPSVSWQRCKAWNHQRHRGDDLEKAMKLSMSVSTESLRAPSSALESLRDFAFEGTPTDQTWWPDSLPVAEGHWLAS